jgi:hypothetical protein
LEEKSMAFAINTVLLFFTYTIHPMLVALVTIGTLKGPGGRDNALPRA